MCGRYYFSSGVLDEISDLTEKRDWKLELGLMDKDIHPGDVAPVIVAAKTEDGGFAGTAVTLRLCMQRWGYPGPDGKGLVFNARSESVFEKRMFRESVSHRRAVIPVSWFYEWNKSKEKYTFTGEYGRVLFLAGFYGMYEDGEHFVILTTEANASMSPVHSRMPLVLGKDQVAAWIVDGDKTRALLGQTPAALVRSCEYEQQTLF